MDFVVGGGPRTEDHEAACSSSQAHPQQQPDVSVADDDRRMATECRSARRRLAETSSAKSSDSPVMTTTTRQNRQFASDSPMQPTNGDGSTSTAKGCSRWQPGGVGRPLTLILLFAMLIARASAIIEMDRCRDRSCYPATGNLLIGREHMLNVTSTCGLVQPQRYCIVSYLDDEKKCFFCDSRREYIPEYNKNSHRIDNIVTDNFDERKTKWWQSENGRQEVSIRLDLEAEFHFTHMIITFKSFRPASMIVERSADFGNTWKVYRYFAHDCASQYPEIDMGPPRAHTDVICTEQYSGLQPSTGGEVVLKVLAPHIPLDNPYADATQDLIRITNLRVNFTKMHTLGDDLLDNRPEILEKYFYAVYDMVVRGSCSCYGHARHCMPMPGQRTSQSPDMVHGRCECTHNTQGMNCEQCLDFYNDLPWQPATEEDTNECKICQCNQHATRCHFDRAVFEASGHVSGGVCDECEHNTMGKNCEQCKPYFYRDHARPIEDPYVCRPCQCDVRGAKNDGLCDQVTDEERDLVAGQCHCKLNVAGELCQRCKHGFWNLTQDNAEGCEQCACYTQGTVNNEGCHKQTGECTCKRYVTGEACDQCLPDHYGLSSDADGCKPCDCDLGGSLSATCDVQNGQCECRPHFSGRRCNQTDSGYFCPAIDYYRYEAERANLTEAETEPRELEQQRRKSWTGAGFARVRHGSRLTFTVANLPYSTTYTPVLRFESRMSAPWSNVQFVFVRPGDVDPNGPCADTDVNGDIRSTIIQPGGAYVEVEPPVCLESGVDYEVRLVIGAYEYQDPAASFLIDSLILTPPTDDLEIFENDTAVIRHHKDQYQRYQCRHSTLSITPMDQMSEVCKRYVCPVAAITARQAIDCECSPTGSKSGICSVHGGQCDCHENIVGRQCDRCAEGTYGYDTNGCESCECDSVGALHNFCDVMTGQCVCREKGIYGRKCDQCEPGFWNFPDCQPCQCNNHADICDQKTGACIECRDLTTGGNCDRCQDGYYGDPRLGVDIPCRPCPCPGGPGSGKQHADTCYLNPGTEQVMCNCKQGYVGDRCDSCAVNYWGNPAELGGSCEPCGCNDNIDRRVPESCDAETGDCVKCLHNTVGPQCEHCAAGFHGDAKIRDCRQCVCNQMGTNATGGPCDRVTGQCVCLPNVIGVQCDQCDVNHWKYESGRGCDACDCDPTGVRQDVNGEPILQCNDRDGQCACKEDRGGRRCDQCQDLYWGDPTANQCQRCECNYQGSITQQCYRNNGTCQCLPGSGGRNCDECARGYTGQWPYCQACGECFQNWDLILTDLKAETSRLVNQANNIEDTGVASVYDEDFNEMEEKLGIVKTLLDTANVTADDVDRLQKDIDALNQQITGAKDKLNKVDEGIAKVTGAVDEAQVALESLQDEADLVEDRALELEENATKLREADVEGAYNITKESAQKSQAAKRLTEKADSYVAQSETKRREAEQLFKRNQDDFDKQYQENQQSLEELDKKMSTLEARLPNLNEQICGAPGDPCDEVCGGPTCGICGGVSCDRGSVSNANRALDFAKKAAQMLETKQLRANKVLDEIDESMKQTEDAKREADAALVAAQAAAQQANKTRTDLEAAHAAMKKFLEKDRADPAQVRTLAEEILAMEISLTPEEIRALSEQIRENLAKLENIDSILAETRGNLTAAQSLKQAADLAKKNAVSILNTTTGVQDALDAATSAQNKAKEAIEQANANIETARDDLDTIELDTAAAEGFVNDSQTALEQLGDELNAVRRSYVEIDQDVANARNSTETAGALTELAEQKRSKLEKLYDQAGLELKSKGAGDMAPKKRAEALRKQAAELLEQSQKHLRQIETRSEWISASELQLAKSADAMSDLVSRAESAEASINNKGNFDSNDVRLQKYATDLDALNIRMDTCTSDIQRRLNFYETCD